MATSNIKLFDENKGNMLTDTEFNISTQRLNGLQTGVASSQLQNKAMYQASLVAYAIAQMMLQNGLNANDTDAVSAFVANLSGTILQKVYDLATTEEAQAGVATGKWMSPALVKAAIDELAAKAQNILLDSTKEKLGLNLSTTPSMFLDCILMTKFVIDAPETAIITCVSGDKTAYKVYKDSKWVFYITDYGEWTVTAVIGASQTIVKLNVTSPGIYEFGIYEQLQNYKMLYDDGTVMTELTGEWSGDNYWSTENYLTLAIPYDGNNPHSGYMQCAKVVDATGYGFLAITLKSVSITHNNNSGNNFEIYDLNASGTSEGTIYGTNDKTVATPILAKLINSDLRLKFWGRAQKDSYWNSQYCTVYMYSVMLMKQDDYQPLVDMLGLVTDSEDNFIANYYSQICNSLQSVTYFTAKLTGTFMIKAISNENFVKAVISSPYKSIITGNSIWHKFLLTSPYYIE